MKTLESHYLNTRIFPKNLGWQCHILVF